MQSKATSDGKDLCRTYRERTFRNSERHKRGSRPLGIQSKHVPAGGHSVAFDEQIGQNVRVGDDHGRPSDSALACNLASKRTLWLFRTRSMEANNASTFTFLSVRLVATERRRQEITFAVQGAVILLRLLLEFEVKAIRQILDGNRRHNKKTITQPFWLSGGGLQHFFERLTNHPVVAPRLPCCISLQGRWLWRRMIRYLRRPNRPLHQRISRNLLGNK